MHTSREGITTSAAHHPSHKTRQQFCTSVQHFQNSEQNGEKEENAVVDKHQIHSGVLESFWVYLKKLMKWYLSLQKTLTIRGQRQCKRKLIQSSRYFQILVIVFHTQTTSPNHSSQTVHRILGACFPRSTACISPCICRDESLETCSVQAGE